MTGWEPKKIGDVLKLEYGKPLPQEKRNEAGAYVAYGANGIKCRTNEYYRDKASIIVGRKGSAGEVNLTEEKFWPLDVTYFVTFDEQRYDLMFLYYCLQCLNLPVLVKGVNRNDVYALQTMFPPLPEQKRIVAILDEAFAGIDAAVDNTEKNLANARELFESYLNAVFTQKGDGWVEMRLKEGANINYGYTAKAKPETIGPKFLRITDIQDNSVDWNMVPYCEVSEKDHAKHKLHDGDIVFARTGATTGKSFLVKNPPDAVCASYLIRLALKDSRMLPEFLILYFQTNEYWSAINLGISGSAQGGFNVSKLGDLIVPVAPFAEQVEIIKKATELHAETQQLESIYQQKLSTLAELKQSILQKAFAGELTTLSEKAIEEAVA